ncbi:hypothetical protein TWF281_002635 [Arthrobotrys megalospora]
MGLFDEYGHSIGLLVDCYLEIQVVGLRSCVSLRILFRNKSGPNVQNAVFRARTAVGAVVTSAECYVDVDGKTGLEYRDIVDFCHQGSTFECDVGSISSNRDCVVFLRYEHDLVTENDTTVLRFPLPGRRGEKLIARQKTQPALWNASQMFSFIALDVQVMNFPAKITNVSSSHSVYASINDESNAAIEVDDYMFQGQDEVMIRILSEPLSSRPTSFHALTSSDTMSENIPVINVVDETTSDYNASIVSGTEALSFDFEGTRSATPSRPTTPSGAPPTIEVERLYSDIWEVNTARLSYSSSGEESISSNRSERLRRRKTTVHKKHNSNVSSTNTDLSEMSWLDDPSDDEVNDEAERIFEEYSLAPPKVVIRDSIAITDEFDVEECKSIRIVRPHRPKLVTIPSMDIPMLSLDNFTPPSSPTRSMDHSSQDLLGEIETLFDSLNELVEWSPTSYIQLDDKFADVLGLQLGPLRNHRGAQAFNLPDTPSWVREGIWANALTLQFLRCVMDSPFFKTLSEEIRSEYKLLYTLIELPFSSHIQHLSPEASLNRLSEEELMELAAEVIQDQLIEGEESPSAPASNAGERVKRVPSAGTYDDPFVCRPISPPKTPDDEDRNMGNKRARLNPSSESQPLLNDYLARRQNLAVGISETPRKRRRRVQTAPPDMNTSAPVNGSRFTPINVAALPRDGEISPIDISGMGGQRVAEGGSYPIASATVGYSHQSFNVTREGHGGNGTRSQFQNNAQNIPSNSNMWNTNARIYEEHQEAGYQSALNYKPPLPLQEPAPQEHPNKPNENAPQRQSDHDNSGFKQSLQGEVPLKERRMSDLARSIMEACGRVEESMRDSMAWLNGVPRYTVDEPAIQNPLTTAIETPGLGPPKSKEEGAIISVRPLRHYGWGGVIEQMQDLAEKVCTIDEAGLLDRDVPVVAASKLRNISKWLDGVDVAIGKFQGRKERGEQESPRSLDRGTGEFLADLQVARAVNQEVSDSSHVYWPASKRLRKWLPDHLRLPQHPMTFWGLNALTCCDVYKKLREFAGTPLETADGQVPHWDWHGILADYIGLDPTKVWRTSMGPGNVPPVMDVDV